LFFVSHSSDETVQCVLSAFFETVIECEGSYYTRSLLTYHTRECCTCSDLAKVEATMPYYSVTEHRQDNALNSLLCGPLHFLGVKAWVVSYWSACKNGVKVCVHCWCEL